MNERSSAAIVMRFRMNLVFILIGVLWTALILAMSVISYEEAHYSATQMALSAARDSFQKDLVYRRWAGGHGGLYVPVTPETPPNPYMGHLPERDIVTPSGKELTLINPAYMTRQVHELGFQQYGLRGHITSLNPLRPENEPDEWERAALEKFREGDKEVSSIEKIGAKQFLRLMLPMTTEKSCLKCHEVQGYREGEIRGGISVSVPWDSSFVDSHTRDHLFQYAFIWTLGIGGLIFSRKSLQRHLSERDTAENELRESKELFQTFLDSSSDLAFVKDIQHRYIFVNKANADLFGVPADDIIGKTDSDFMGPKEAAECQRSDSLVLSSKSLSTTEEFLNGRVFEARKFPLTLSRGEIAVGGLIREITEQKQAQEEVRKRENLLSKVLDILPIGLWISDSKGKLLIGNPAGTKIWGSAPYVGQDDYGVFKARRLPSGKEIEPDDWALAHTVNEGVTISDELLEIDTFDGRKRIIVNHTAPVMDDDGNVQAAIVVNQDVTDRLQAEQEKLEMERRLLHAQKLESLGVMSGGIAHDFNNLLTVIVGNLELALMDISPESPATRSIGNAIKAARRSADLTRQMLAYSGRGSFITRDIRITDIVKENADMFRTAISKNINLILSLVPNLPLVRADASQIQQVVMNLIINASESIGDSPGEIKVTTGAIYCDESFLTQSLALNKPQPGEFVYLEVGDTGCGMEEETIKRLFDPFFTTKFTGRGLGMSAVLGIVNGHNGAINVESKVGEGTTVSVFFPVSASQSVEAS